MISAPRRFLPGTAQEEDDLCALVDGPLRKLAQNRIPTKGAGQGDHEQLLISRLDKMNLSIAALRFVRRLPRPVRKFEDVIGDLHFEGVSLPPISILDPLPSDFFRRLEYIHREFVIRSVDAFIEACSIQMPYEPQLQDDITSRIDDRRRDIPDLLNTALLPLRVPCHEVSIRAVRSKKDDHPFVQV